MDSSISRRLAEVRKKIAELDKVITADEKAFSRALQESVRLRTEEEALLEVRDIVIRLYNRIVTATPVDTGRAAASWQFDVQTEPEGSRPEGDYASRINAIVAETTDEILAAPMGKWFIANHLDYIEALAAGWSKQAPAGMVSLALQEFTRELQKRTVAL